MDERRQKTELINSFLAFVAADLENASVEEKIKWYSFTLKAMGPYASYLLTPPPSDGDLYCLSDEDFCGAKAFQEAWNVALHRLVAFTEGKTVAAIYYVVPHFFTWGCTPDSIFNNFVHPHATFSPLKAKIFDGKIFDNMNYFEQLPDRIDHREMEFPPGFMDFMEALSGFPTRSLKSCLHCLKLFFAPTNLRKRYCSPYCQKVASVYRARRKKKSV